MSFDRSALVAKTGMVYLSCLFVLLQSLFLRKDKNRTCVYEFIEKYLYILVL